MAVKKSKRKLAKKARPVRAKLKKKPARKPAKKAIAKKTVSKKARPVAKAVKKDLSKLKKGLRKEITLTKKVGKKATRHDKELVLLRKELEKLKGKKKSGTVSTYNIFMRQQIKKGLTFKQAAKAWNKRKKELAKKNKKRTAYNIFISMQLKQGRTMKQAIAAWNKLKRPARNPRKRPARNPRKRPARKSRPLTRVKRLTVEKPVFVTKHIFPGEKIEQIVENALRKFKGQETLRNVAAAISASGPASDEELALEMLEIYFSDVARSGFKRKLSLDEVINSYFYALLRVQRKSVELGKVREAALRKDL